MILDNVGAPDLLAAKNRKAGEKEDEQDWT
jgi:hypothetical protein